MIEIIFVCTGNICRSPMAEGLLNHKWHLAGRDDLLVSSMGTHGLDNHPATEPAQQVCLENGFDISSHRSRPLAGEDLQSSDLIFCMEPIHTEFIGTFFPWYRNRVFLLGAWPGKKTRKSPVPDPMGGEIELYRKIFKLIDGHMERILPKLLTY
jgi:protein-tyrosine-phosphatase